MQIVIVIGEELCLVVSAAMGIRRPAEKVHWIRKNSILHSALGASVMITSVKYGNITVTMTPNVKDL